MPFHSETSPGDATHVDAVVIGAGFSGLYMLHRLRGLGLSARVYETGEDVGGTWYWNRYPGARCDVESVYYSYSFSRELEQEWEWSRRYPDQPEVLAYLGHVADRFDLRRDIQFCTTVTAATFDEARNDWSVHTDRGDAVRARFLITAVGCLSATNVPDIPGLETFSGEWYHTGAWPHEGVDLRGKRVGLVGTGSTGIQATPVIADEAAHLTVFQRTPNFTVPAQDGPLEATAVRELKTRYPEIRENARHSFVGLPVDYSETSAFEVTPEEREKVYEAGWRRGGFYFLFESFQDLLVDQTANDTAAEFVRSKIRGIVEDPETAELLSPRDHPYGTKRPPLDTKYYETFNRDNVTLVDVRTWPIQAITPTGIRTANGSFDLDVIVFATGFDAMTGTLAKIDLRGRGGRSLAEKWEAGPRTYLGLGIAGFPNLFTITGPCSPSVLSNMVVSIEQHVDWISDCIDHMAREGHTRIEATEVAEEAWVDHTNEAADATLYPRANSWYLGANIPGKTRVFMPYVGGVGTYRQICDEVAARGYEGFALGT
ncbi:MAG TPA: NAD(P)/FAD-dependent oxidoreductase [Acidimicrobiales bacterium]|nr:NAD(P)/FAD-dependent oxidoreductase [Acidimicrobiales bacterium]